MEEKSETLCSPFFESLKDTYSKKIFDGEVAINYETDQDWSIVARIKKNDVPAYIRLASNKGVIEGIITIRHLPTSTEIHKEIIINAKIPEDIIEQLKQPIDEILEELNEKVFFKSNIDLFKSKCFSFTKSKFFKFSNN